MRVVYGELAAWHKPGGRITAGRRTILSIMLKY